MYVKCESSLNSWLIYSHLKMITTMFSIIEGNIYIKSGYEKRAGYEKIKLSRW